MSTGFQDVPDSRFLEKQKNYRNDEKESHKCKMEVVLENMISI